LIDTNSVGRFSAMIDVMPLPSGARNRIRSPGFQEPSKYDPLQKAEVQIRYVASSSIVRQTRVRGARIQTEK
jgi:hypothetical protein